MLKRIVKLIKLLCVVIGPVLSKHVEVLCFYNCHTNTNATFQEPPHTCHVTAKSNMAWSEIGDKVAPPPIDMWVDWYLWKPTNRVTFNLTWAMKEHEFMQHSDHAFVVSVLRESAVELRYLVEVEIHKQSLQSSLTECKKSLNCQILFNYHHCGNSGFIKTGYDYLWTVMTMPVYRPNTEKQSRNVSIRVPCCCFEPVVTAAECQGQGMDCTRCNNEYEYVSDYEYLYYNNFKDGNSSFYLLKTSSLFLGVLLLLIFVSIAVLILWKIQNKEVKGANKFGPVLMLVNTCNEDFSYLQKCMQVAEILTQLGAVKVETNLWTQITEAKSHWLHNSFTSCSHFVLFFTPKTYATLKQNIPIAKLTDACCNGVELIKQQPFSGKHITLVCFEKACLQFVKKEFNHLTGLSQCRVFSFDSDTSAFFKHVSGCSNSISQAMGNNYEEQQLCLKVTTV